MDIASLEDKDKAVKSSTSKNQQWSPLIVASAVSFFLVVLKLIAFLLTNSLIILSSLLDSIADSFMSLVNSRVQKHARQRADKEHPFGHGGYEVIASLLQGSVILLLGAYLLFDAIQRIITREHSVTQDQSNFYISAGVLTFAALAGFGIQAYLAFHERRMAKKRERSLALAADRAHYLGDVWFNLFNLTGIGLSYYFDIGLLDTLCGGIGSLMLIKVSLPLLRQCIRDILQTEAPQDIKQEIVDIIRQVDFRIKGVHRLRSRYAGPTLYLDFHLKLPSDMILLDAHKIGERVTNTLKKHFVRCDVIIHLDPDMEPDDDLWKPDYTFN